VVSLPEIAHPTHIGELHVLLDDLLGVRLRQMDLGDDSVRVPQSVRERLQPSCLLDGIESPYRALDVDRLDDVGEARLGDPVIGPVALRLDSLHVVEDVALHAGLGPAVLQPGVLQVVEVDVRVDERDLCHRSPPFA
jgi:hypothetical protein